MKTTAELNLNLWKAQRQLSELLSTLNKWESETIDSGIFNAVGKVEKIQAVKDKVIDAQEELNRL